MYRARFVIVFSIVLATLALLATLLIVPSYFALRLASPPPVDINITKRAGAPDDAVAIARAQAIVRALSPLLNSTSSPSSSIALALATRPAGVVVQNISYAGDTFELTLTGTAARGAVNAYRDSLTADTHFRSVSVPVSALVGTEGGRFSITLGIAH